MEKETIQNNIINENKQFGEIHYNITSQIHENDGDKWINLEVTMVVSGIKIKWKIMDITGMHGSFVEFMENMTQNKSACLAGGGNSYWHLVSFRNFGNSLNNQTCVLCFDIGGSGGDSNLSIQLPTEFTKIIISEFNKYCTEFTNDNPTLPVRESPNDNPTLPVNESQKVVKICGDHIC